jgi:hypothetical protein
MQTIIYYLAFMGLSLNLKLSQLIPIRLLLIFKCIFVIRYLFIERIFYIFNPSNDQFAAQYEEQAFRSRPIDCVFEFRTEGGYFSLVLLCVQAPKQFLLLSLPQCTRRDVT